MYHSHKVFINWQLSYFKIAKDDCKPALMKANPFSPSMSRTTNINTCVAAHIHKDCPSTRLTPGQTCSISVLTTVFTGSWLPNQYCRLRYTTPQLGHSITYLQKRKTDYLSEILEVQRTRQYRGNKKQRYPSCSTHPDQAYLARPSQGESVEAEVFGTTLTSIPRS